MAAGGRDFGSNDGTVIPNRVFVGGISGDINENDLWNLFSNLGNVKSTNIVLDKGISKGYGFVTFETEEDARKVLNNSERLILKGSKLNIAQAKKKQPYGRALERSAVHGAPIVWPAQQYSGTSIGFSRDSMYYPQSSWPFMWPQFYFQQQCQYSHSTQSSYPQYVYSLAPPSDYPFQAATQGVNCDYSENSPADYEESVKNRCRQTVSTAAEYERGKQSRSKASSTSQSSSSSSVTSVSRLGNGSVDTSPNCVHSSPVHPLGHPVFTKTLNGMNVLAYPRSFVVGSPVIHVKDDTDNVFPDPSGFLQNSLAHGALTPPSTPSYSPSDYNSNVESIRQN